MLSCELWSVKNASDNISKLTGTGFRTRPGTLSGLTAFSFSLSTGSFLSTLVVDTDSGWSSGDS